MSWPLPLLLDNVTNFTLFWHLPWGTFVWKRLYYAFYATKELQYQLFISNESIKRKIHWTDKWAACNHHWPHHTCKVCDSLLIPIISSFTEWNIFRQNIIKISSRGGQPDLAVPFPSLIFFIHWCCRY